MITGIGTHEKFGLKVTKSTKKNNATDSHPINRRAVKDGRFRLFPLSIPKY